jgi:hypothetical protein
MKFKLYFFIVALVAISPIYVAASTVRLSTDSFNVSLDKEFTVTVILDSEEGGINALEGVVTLDQEIFEIVGVHTGDSGVNFWIEHPKEEVSQGGIVFSGMTPGGMWGSNIKIFSLILKAKSLGSGFIEFRDVGLFSNDGAGTKAQVFTRGATVLVGPHSESNDFGIVVDMEPPEPFPLYLGKDPAIFEGDYFLAFSAQDKGSGVDHYQIKEGVFGGYSRAVSPYRLKHQSLSGSVFVKAVDREGNERISVYGSKEDYSWWEKAVNFDILNGSLIFILLLSIFLWKKFSQ